MHIIFLPLVSFVDGTSDVVLDNTYKEYLFTFNNMHPATDGMLIDNSGFLAKQVIYQALITSTTINNIKISPNTGTIVSGTFTLYGVAT